MDKTADYLRLKRNFDLARIRAAVFLRDMAISGFVLGCLRRSSESEASMEFLPRVMSRELR